MNAELTFLQFLQSLHSPMLDGSMCFITRLGDSGVLWVTLTAVLLVFRKTRRVGCVLAAALLIDAVLCNLLLKPLVARVRPCDILTEYPVPGRFLLSFGPYGGVLRLGDSPLDGREKAVGDGGSAGRRSHRILADVPLCPLPDGYSGWRHFGSRLRMGGSMARKESRAPNGHPAELKKEEETAVQQLAVRRSLLLWGPAYLREHLGFPQKAQKTCRRLNASPKIWPRKKKSTVLPAKYSAFLVENSGIEPLTSCMPCKRSPS